MLKTTTQEKIEKLDAILSIAEVADFFSIHRLTVYRMIQKKELDAYKDCEGEWCINRVALKKYCEKKSNL